MIPMASTKKISSVSKCYRAFETLLQRRFNTFLETLFAVLGYDFSRLGNYTLETNTSPLRKIKNWLLKADMLQLLYRLCLFFDFFGGFYA